jgi:Acetyltransferases
MVTCPPEVSVRPYEQSSHEEKLWDCKQAFERELGAKTGDSEKADIYNSKLTTTYHNRWLEWVSHCAALDPGCIAVATVDDCTQTHSSNKKATEVDGYAGYAFLLPGLFGFIWDAAVLNELYVVPSYRGEGVADALFEVILATAREQTLPVNRLVLDVDPENERARKFYDRHGCNRWGEMLTRSL